MNALGNQKNRTLLPVMAAMLASLLVISIWFVSRGDVESPRIAMEADMPVYSSLEGLSSVSDLVIVGTMGEVVARDVDYGEENPPEGAVWGIPVVFYEITVTEVLRGELGQDVKTIVVGALDVDRVDIDEDSTTLLNGHQVLLFLNDADAPGITAVDDYYVRVSMDNGVFDVVGGIGEVGPTGRVDDSVILKPRGTREDMFGEMTFAMSEIRRAIEPESGEVGPTGNTD